jgi:hypothetical protein
MSVTFSPGVNYHNLKEEELDWTADYIQHCDWDNLPQQWKDFADKSYVNGDIGYFLWKEGVKPLQQWENWAKKYGMIKTEDYPFRKVYVDDPVYKVAIILHGEPKVHKGMEMTLANGNADTLCKLLKIPAESGSIHPQALIKKIDDLQSRQISEFTRPESDTQVEGPMGLGGPRIIDFGLSEDKILQYLETLDKICTHCINHECNVTWG